MCGHDTFQKPALPDPIPAPPDFDTRPRSLTREMLESWLQLCRHCGYVAPSVAQLADGVAELVRNEEYQALRRRQGLPAPVKRFLCYAYLLEQMGQIADAGWTSLHAAWLCDDMRAPDAGRECRSYAIGLWKRAKSQGQSFLGTLPEEFAIVADVYRRMGDFEASRETCLEALMLNGLPSTVEDILRAQMTLNQQKDARRHGVDRLNAPPPGAQRVVWE